MSLGTYGYERQIADDEERDAIARAIRNALPHRKTIKAWTALSERKRNIWRFAAEQAVRTAKEVQRDAVRTTP